MSGGGNSGNAGVKKDYPPIAASLAIGLSSESCELRNETKIKEVSRAFLPRIFCQKKKVPKEAGGRFGDGGATYYSVLRKKKVQDPDSS